MKPKRKDNCIDMSKPKEHLKYSDNKLNYGRELDYVLLTAVLLLSGFGVVVMSSAMQNASTGGGDSMFIRHTVLLGVGVAIAFILAAFDYKEYKFFGIFMYLISTVMLVLVKLFGHGESAWGANNWLNIPGLGSFQPSEIAKITFIMMSAVFLSRIKDGVGNKWIQMLKLAIYAAIPIGLILIQPDVGTALVFVFILGIMIFAFGVKYRYVGLLAVLGSAAAWGAWNFFLNELRKDRIRAFLDPQAYDPEGLGSAYQINRSLMTIGSGGATGKGLYQGLNTQNNLVPVKESDFILTVVGEEFGYIGCILVLALLLIIIIRCFMVAKKAKDSYGSLLAAGVAGMIGFHFIENVGMCIGLMPITGIPLPFVSYGSSAMLTNFIAVGIVLSVAMRRRKRQFEAENEKVLS